MEAPDYAYGDASREDIDSFVHSSYQQEIEQWAHIEQICAGAYGYGDAEGPALSGEGGATGMLGDGLYAAGTCGWSPYSSPFQSPRPQRKVVGGRRRKRRNEDCVRCLQAEGDCCCALNPASGVVGGGAEAASHHHRHKMSRQRGEMVVTPAGFFDCRGRGYGAETALFNDHQPLVSQECWNPADMVCGEGHQLGLMTEQEVTKRMALEGEDVGPYDVHAKPLPDSFQPVVYPQSF